LEPPTNPGRFTGEAVEIAMLLGVTQLGIGDFLLI
jgi:hypothetical protein